MVVCCRRCVCCRTVVVVRVVLVHGFNVFHNSTTCTLVLGLVDSDLLAFVVVFCCGSILRWLMYSWWLHTLLRLNRVALDLVGFMLDLVWPRIGQFYLVGVDHNLLVLYTMMMFDTILIWGCSSLESLICWFVTVNSILVVVASVSLWFGLL